MHYSPVDFLNCQPIVSPTDEARERTLLIAAGVFLGFTAGIAFSLMVARIWGAL